MIRHTYNSSGVVGPKYVPYEGGEQSHSSLGSPSYGTISTVSRQAIEERQRGYCLTGSVTCFDCNDSQRQDDNIRCVVCEWRHSQRVK
jgi:hypothetical protein